MDHDCDTGSYAAPFSGGFKCVDGKCSCDTYYFHPVTVSTIEANWASTLPIDQNLQITRQTFCVLNSLHRDDAKEGEPCTIGLAKDISSATMSCSTGFVCLQCPADSEFGVCVDLSNLLTVKNSLSKPNHNLAANCLLSSLFLLIQSMIVILLL